MALMPMGADQPLNAARCADLQLGRVLDALQATPEHVQQAATAVLADETYARNAKRLEAEIAALSGPEHGVRLLERLVA
jgi:UDP:flavonoid glycosyltransferase YjiC (YdhE family)